MTPKRILFSGSAWVHFACAYPVYRRLRRDPRVEFWLTGGFKRTVGEATQYSLAGFYDPFDVDRSKVIPVERARQEDFDLLLCSHLNPVRPRSAARSVQLFHGVSFKNLAVREKYLGFDRLCLAGRYQAEAYRRLGLVRSEGQCLITGVPKIDPLVDGSLDRTAALRDKGLDPARPTILYAPTGSKHNSLETVGREAIRALVDDGRWNLLVKPHDHPKNTDVDWFRELAPMEGDRMRLVREPDVVPFLHAADLLLTDASSVSMEYALLDRPIVFLDVPELFRDVTERGGALDLETHGRKIGTVVEGPGRLVAAIAESLTRPDREREFRKAAARDIFHDPGRAGERATGVVLHDAGLEPALPDGVLAVAPAPAAVGRRG